MKGEWQDGRMRREGWIVRGDEKERKTECEAAVYLPNKLDRISSIIKEEREMGKTRRHADVHAEKASLSVWHTTHTRHLFTHTHKPTVPDLHRSTYLHTHCTTDFRVSSHMCVTVICVCSGVRVCVHMCLGLCVENSESEDKQRLVSDSPQHPRTPPPPHPHPIWLRLCLNVPAPWLQCRPINTNR